MTGITEPLAVAGTIAIADPDGHSLISAGFAHNFVSVLYYSDLEATTVVTPSAGSAVVNVTPVGSPEELIPADGSSGQRWSYNGNATKGNITFTGITGALAARVTVVQNKT
jgi:hypothetical protein